MFPMLQELRKTQLLLGHRHVERLTACMQAAAAAAKAEAESAELSAASIQPVNLDRLSGTAAGGPDVSRSSLSAAEASAAAAAAIERAALARTSTSRPAQHGAGKPEALQRLDLQPPAALPSEGRSPAASLLTSGPSASGPAIQRLREEEPTFAASSPQRHGGESQKAGVQPFFMPRVRGT